MRRFYQPGLISLVLLPTLLIPFFMKLFEERDLRMMKLNMPEEYGDCDTTFWHECIYEADEVNYYRFEELSSEEIEKLFIQVATIRDDTVFRKKNFKKTWILKLNENMEYGDIVNLLNLCMKYDVKYFQWDIYNDNFAFQEMFKEEDENISVEDEIIVWDCILYIEEEPSQYDRMKEIVINNIPLHTSAQKMFFLRIIGFYVVFCGAILIIKLREGF